MITIIIITVLFFIFKSFWTDNEGSTIDEKMRSLDKKIEYANKIKSSINSASFLCRKIVESMSEYYEWVEKTADNYPPGDIPCDVFKVSEEKQLKILSPLFSYNMNFFQDLREAFYSGAIGSNMIIGYAKDWNRKWVQAYDENILYKREAIREQFIINRNEILGIVLLKEVSLNMILTRQAADERTSEKDLEDLMKIFAASKGIKL